MTPSSRPNSKKPVIHHPTPRGNHDGLASRINQSWNMIIDHWKLTTLAALVDFLYLFAFSGIATWAFLRMQGPLNTIYTIAGDNISTLAQDLNNQEALGALLTSQQEFMSAYQTVITTAGWFLLGVFVLWIILQGLSWAISHRITGHHINPKDWCSVKPYLTRFLTISLAGMIAIVGVLYFSIRAAAFVNVARLGGSAQTLVSITVAVMFFAVIYFMFCGYSSNPAAGRGTTWKVAVGNYRRMIPAFFIMLALVYGSNLILIILMEKNVWIGALFGILIMAPIYTYNRVLMIVSARNNQPTST